MSAARRPSAAALQLGRRLLVAGDVSLAERDYPGATDELMSGGWAALWDPPYLGLRAQGLAGLLAALDERP